MKLVSMENVQNYDDISACSPSMDKPKYPYGLSINLSDDVIKALGLEKLPAVGESLKMECVVEVCTVSQHENKDGAEQSLSLQITSLALDKPKKGTVDVLYDKKEE